MSFRLTGLICSVSILSVITGSVRNCPTLSDYFWDQVKENPKCFDNFVVDKNISEIIRSWGFTAEEHYLTTEDGYKLLVERSYHTKTRETPIIIVHGIGMNPLGWVNRGNISLVYLLGNLGYDVWMLGYRGSWYSKGHERLSTNDDEYWKFSINELGIYDVRSTVKYVHKITNHKAIYIGYSMGSTGFLIYSSNFPDEAKEYLKGEIALAPVINYKETKTILKGITPIWPLLKKITYWAWHGEMLPGFSTVLKPLVTLSTGIQMVQLFVNQIFGDDYEQVDVVNYPQFITQLTDTAGAEVFSHYVQLYESGVFQNYDHGKEKNLQIYGTENPPAYDISKVPIPISLFIGPNDWLATPTNAKQLYSELQPHLRCGFHTIQFDKWSHIDFLVAKDIVKYLYNDLFDEIIKIDNGKCET